MNTLAGRGAAGGLRLSDHQDASRVEQSVDPGGLATAFSACEKMSMEYWSPGWLNIW